MTTRVRAIPLSQATPGMVLAAAVCDPGGASLLAEGAALTHATIASLQRRGVARLQIAEEEILTPAQLAQRREEVSAGVAALFRQCGDDPLMAKLREALLAYRLESLE